MAVAAIDIVRKFAPTAKDAYVQAFAGGDAQLAAAGIDRPLRLAHFMAQCLHETGGLTILIESGRYSAANLATMWDSGNWHRYFANRDACIAMAAQCKVDGGVALFSLVYGNRMGNGAPATQDGWRYRGRGILQTTGRESYRNFGTRCQVDFEGNPDLVVDPAHALKPALFEWTDKHLNVAADNNDIETVTRGINGGVVGLSARRAWLAKILPFASAAPPVEKSIEWKVQAALVAKGFDTGGVDGVIGSRSKLAIMAYRAANGLPAGSDITPDLIASLGI